MSELTPLQQGRRARYQLQTAADYDRIVQRQASAYDLPLGLGPAGASAPSPAPAAGGVPLPGGGRVSLLGIPGLTVVESRAEAVTDRRLRDVVQQALTDPALGIRELRISDALRDADAGYGTRGSRHVAGQALDFDRINGRSATLQNPDALRLVQWLFARGFSPGESAGKPGLLFGPVGSRWNPSRFDHSTHLHLSVP